MRENAYLSIKNPKASRALKRALDPGRKLLTSLTQLRFATSATFGLSTWGPPLDQILDPHLSHAQTHTKDCMILAQCWIISFLKDYYCIYLVKWINTEVFFSCNVNIFTVSNTILYSLRIELETYFFFLIYHI